MALPTRVSRGFVDPMDLISREFDGVLNRFFTDGGNGGQRGNWMAPYGVDIREDQDHLYVEADLPGFRKDEVDITMENQTLTISAEHRPAAARMMLPMPPAYRTPEEAREEARRNRARIEAALGDLAGDAPGLYLLGFEVADAARREESAA